MYVRSMLILALIAPATGFAKEKAAEKNDKAKAAVEKQAKDWKGEGFRTEVITEEYVKSTFPNHTFVAVHFAEWPVGRAAPEPMKSRNVFAVDKDGKVTHFRTARNSRSSSNPHWSTNWIAQRP